MNTTFTTLALLAVCCALAVFSVNQCRSHSEELDARQKAESIATDLTIKEAVASQLLADKKAQDSKRDADVTKDEQSRKDRDSQTMLLIAAMSKPQQNSTALDYLIANGFLTKQQAAKAGQVSSDSSVTRAVAVQGRVLSDTRVELARKDTVYHEAKEQLSDLEGVLNDQFYRVSDTRMQVQNYISERGLFRGHSRRQLHEVDKSLSEQQKALQNKRISSVRP